MKIRFQADADLHYPIVSGVRRRAPVIDFQSAAEAGLRGLDDPAVLVYAATENRLLVSHDVSTMPDHFAAFIAAHKSPGVVLIAQELPYRLAIEGLLKLWFDSEAEDWRNVLFFLPH